MEMVISDALEAIKVALERVDERYWELSQKDYSRVQADISFRKILSEEKILERPFAYEFYYQFRKLMDEHVVDFGGPIIQAEVDKTYQHCFKSNHKATKRGKIPDFLIHLPNSRQNLAVIEFKLATNLSKLKSDFKKLIEFRKNERLQYDNGIEVIIGNTESLESAKRHVEDLRKSKGEEIVVVFFNTESRKANNLSLTFKA